jgi:transcriptional regulator with XRE-family HTH domain
MNLGETIKQVRLNGLHPSTREFAKGVGLSREGLRKIEGGRSIPSDETLKSIIDFSGAPSTVAHDLRRMRDDLKIQQIGRPDRESVDTKQLSRRLTQEVQRYLADCHMRLPEEERAYLQGVFSKVLDDELSGQPSPASGP